MNNFGPPPQRTVPARVPTPPPEPEEEAEPEPQAEADTGEWVKALYDYSSTVSRLESLLYSVTLAR